MESVLNWSVILSLVGVLMVLTNIVVQVLKKVTWGKIPTNILAILVSMVLTMGAFLAYCQIKSIAMVYGVRRSRAGDAGGLRCYVRI